MNEVFNGGVVKDGIPALSNPLLVDPGDAGLDFLLPSDRVIAIRVGEGHIAVPLNVLWYHEVVNFDLEDFRLAVTYCPLTGSSLVFDRIGIEGAELGVSGLLYRNNLIMYDRRQEESLFPQMLRSGGCGPEAGLALAQYPSVEMNWEGWRSLHPDGRVVSGETGFSRRYDLYPYGDYDVLENTRTLFPVQLDGRRPPKERVLGIPVAREAGMAYPFGILAKEQRQAVHRRIDDGLLVVFWDRDLQAAAAYFSMAEGRELRFEIRNGAFRDVETGTTWSFDGRALAGPLEGRALGAYADAYVAYWFAWAAFQPATDVWGQ
jgi:hypothetical protein